MVESEFDYETELKKFCEYRGIWNEEKGEPTRPVYPILETRNQKYDEESGGYYGGEQFVKEFTIKPPKQKTCQYCFAELKGRHRKFCSLRCNDLYSKIKNKVNELGSEIIFWHENKSREIPNQKDMNVVYRGENEELFTDYDDGITNKSGKQLPRKDQRESRDFSKGNDFDYPV